jgi:hypothetical protein
VASRLARLYNADTRPWDHVDRLLASGSETACRWNAGAPPRDRFALHYERAPLVLEDLSKLPDHPPVIAEGTVFPRPARLPLRVRPPSLPGLRRHAPASVNLVGLCPTNLTLVARLTDQAVMTSCVASVLAIPRSIASIR